MYNKGISLLVIILILLFVFKVFFKLLPFILLLLLIGMVVVVIKAKKENREINAEFIASLFEKKDDNIIEGEYEEREVVSDDSESTDQ